MHGARMQHIGITFFQHHIGQPRREDERYHQRGQHAHAGIDRNRAHIRPHQAGHEGHRQQRRDHSEGRQNGRTTDFIHRQRNQLFQLLLALRHVQRHVPVNVFHHHDGIINQNTDGENQREQRNPVQGKAVSPGSKQRDQQGHRHRCAHDQAFTPTQRPHHQQNHRNGFDDEFLNQFVRLGLRRGAVISRDGDLDIIRDKGAFQLLDALLHLVGDVDRIGA